MIMESGVHASFRLSLLMALVALCAALVLILASVLNAQRSLADLNTMADARGRARTARLYVEHTLSLFKDVETGMRGFLLTGLEAHLEPYHAARLALPESYAALRTEISRAIDEPVDWSQLDAEVERRLAVAGRLVDLRRQHGSEAVEEQPLLAEGKAAMDVIRTRFAAFDESIARRLAELDQSVEKLRREASRSDWLMAGVAVALVLLATALLLRERQVRIRLEEELRRTNRSLDARVQERTHELSEARDRIAGFAAELQRGVEDERRRISREVHDQIGQVFTAIRMIVRGLPADAMPGDQAAVLERAVDMGVTTARRIAAELRPPLLDDLGLQAAVTHFAEGLFQPAGIACSVAIDDGEMLGETATLAVFRILQEACNNILRHAEAHHVRIDGGAADNVFRITILDDGRGLPATAIRSGALGIIGMKERAALLGGLVSVDNEAGGGVCVRITMPLGANDRRGHEDPAA